MQIKREGKKIQAQEYLLERLPYSSLDVANPQGQSSRLCDKTLSDFVWYFCFWLPHFFGGK
jgi:hypothetical protein